MKKKNLKILKLNKKSISSFNVLGGRPPGSHNCDIVDPGPITIETICWTQSRDIASECWCSSDDSFHC